MKHIVIIGGGFAGINLARALAGNNNFEVTLVDKNNYNFFPPLIYQVATAFLEPSSISYPFRKLFRKKKNLRFRLGELKQVVPAENRIILSNGDLQYDYLVFATGAETNYFGMLNVKQHAIPMKTLHDAIAMRNRMLQQMEQAIITQDEAERKKLLTFVIAGGGPTGVEISGMLAEMGRTIVLKDYPELHGKRGEIYLVDGSEALLSPMSKQSQKDTHNALRRMGVRIRLNVHVKDYVNDTVILDDGDTIEAKTLIWAAGVTARIFEGIPATSYGRGKRMIVDGFNKVQGTENIYAIGDTCLQTADEKFPNGHPQVAQVAIQQGKHMAKNFKAMETGKTPTLFHYHDKGSMAIIGRNKAVADLPPTLHFRGVIAFFLWLFVHVMSLINYRNRLKTLYNWTVAYFSKDQSLRMIIRPDNEK
ncbi:NAD(P)/FAD-dependent oxidoreductase [Chitinophaga agrisoli]|uniref:NADH:ubiquinone reductase (non-electrogenic) n=1 Tax=Chitinophaga agrisoli TaxID=2607653 RepID=A0A5B2VN07_9BACT|nr:NAD(P)/FAD-dependent oxidoreductase [Chitinophaga agrisoli]KAA2240395.1 NAD(P)/FAD-dependent oxidoreductase [Chitinophaga agrisoli]